MFQPVYKKFNQGLVITKSVATHSYLILS